MQKTVGTLSFRPFIYPDISITGFFFQQKQILQTKQVIEPFFNYKPL